MSQNNVNTIKPVGIADTGNLKGGFTRSESLKPPPPPSKPTSNTDNKK